jgi:hypothetical protein
MKQKLLPILIFLLFTSFLLPAQNDKLINDRFSNSSQFLFIEYLNADIKLKNGEFVNTDINYNLLFQQIWYEDNNQYFIVKEPNLIEYIELENYKYLVINSIIYEIIAHSNKHKVLKHQKINHEPHKKNNGPYGTSTYTTAQRNVTSFITQPSGVNKIKSNSDLAVDIITNYYILDNDDNIYDLSKRKLCHLFENKEESIKKYFKKNKISLKNENEIIELFKYIVSK